jgi:hypothetical protein
VLRPLFPLPLKVFYGCADHLTNPRKVRTLSQEPLLNREREVARLYRTAKGGEMIKRTLTILMALTMAALLALSAATVFAAPHTSEAESLRSGAASWTNRSFSFL